MVSETVAALFSNRVEICTCNIKPKVQFSKTQLLDINFKISENT